MALESAETGSEAAASNAEWQPSVNPWLIALPVILPAFMEVLDTSIANVVLNNIAGSMSSSYSQATWVLTSYLISNAALLAFVDLYRGMAALAVIVIPIVFLMRRVQAAGGAAMH